MTVSFTDQFLPVLIDSTNIDLPIHKVMIDKELISLSFHEDITDKKYKKLLKLGKVINLTLNNLNFKKLKINHLSPTTIMFIPQSE